MYKLQLSLLLSILSLMFVTFTHSASLPEAARVRRSSADQRIAELQALLALSSGRTRSNYVVAHGLFDPDAIGKKKRDFSNQQASGSEMTDGERYNLLKALITKAAMGNTS